ncbi:MAG: lipoyl(octanoyl) transferase LipB [Planctomycetota bacterium]|jgi:lipoate-protein ligase B
MSDSDSAHHFIYQKKFSVTFEDAMDIQLAKAGELKKERDKPGLLLLAEHTPVITMGRSGEKENLLAAHEALEAAGVSYHETRRGGDITYHGPGQITMYPVFPMEWYWRDLHRYMRTLEETCINYLKNYNLHGERIEGLTGVWIGNEKIAAIGIAVSGWITYYGMAVNISPDMNHFSLIRPCGIEDKGVTSLTKLTGKEYIISEEMDKLSQAFCDTFGNTELITS